MVNDRHQKQFNSPGGAGSVRGASIQSAARSGSPFTDDDDYMMITEKLDSIEHKLAKGARRANRYKEHQRLKAVSLNKRVEETRQQAIPSLLDEKVLIPK